MAQQVRRTRSPVPRQPVREPGESGAPVPSPARVRPVQATQRLEKLEDDALLSSLRENRDRLCTCFDIFEILYQNSVPQRCLEHNNFLTLYCENEQKMLCVNCIYGNTLHRMHTVTPIKNVFERIIEDNRAMERRLQQALEVIKETEKAATDYVKDGEEGLNRVLRQLDEEYERLHNLLTDKYNQSRTAILGQFNEAKLKNDLLLEEIAWLKTTYSDREKSLPRSSEQASVIYMHLMLTALLEDQPLNPRLVRALNFEDIRAEYVGELTRIRQLIEGGKTGQRRRLF